MVLEIKVKIYRFGGFWFPVKKKTFFSVNF